ncbi:hypothetical protein [Archangium lipolyticum]|uniref:hypothetical protein n=1 Tax=Archangium lipolyticum TaxID=2970465 RepID=UPI00214A4D90|nr:hypothetical protein [Archangium lipolyticum]
MKVLRQPRTAASLREEVEDRTRRLAQCESGGQASAASELVGVLPGLLAQEVKGLTRLPWAKVGDYVVGPGSAGAATTISKLLFSGSGGRSEAAVRVMVKNTASEGWVVEEVTPHLQVKVRGSQGAVFL